MAKNVTSMEGIIQLFRMQRSCYDPVTAYNYFCSELENMLWHICGLKDTVDNIGVTNTEVKTMFRSLIIAASQIIFLNSSLDMYRPQNTENTPE